MVDLFFFISVEIEVVPLEFFLVFTVSFDGVIKLEAVNKPDKVILD